MFINDFKIRYLIIDEYGGNNIEDFKVTGENSAFIIYGEPPRNETFECVWNPESNTVKINTETNLIPTCEIKYGWQIRDYLNNMLHSNLKSGKYNLSDDRSAKLFLKKIMEIIDRDTNYHGCIIL